MARRARAAALEERQRDARGAVLRGERVGLDLVHEQALELPAMEAGALAHADALGAGGDLGRDAIVDHDLDGEPDPAGHRLDLGGEGGRVQRVGLARLEHALLPAPLLADARLDAEDALLEVARQIEVGGVGVEPGARPAEHVDRDLREALGADGEDHAVAVRVRAALRREPVLHRILHVEGHGELLELDDVGLRARAVDLVAGLGERLLSLLEEPLLDLAGPRERVEEPGLAADQLEQRGGAGDGLAGGVADGLHDTDDGTHGAFRASLA